MSLHLLLRPSIGRHVGRNEVKLLNEQCRQPPLHHTRPGCPRGRHRRWIERNRAWWPVVPTFTRPRAASRAPGPPNRLGPPPTGWGAEPPTPPTPPTRSGLPPPTCSGLNPNLLGVPPNGLGATVTGTRTSTQRQRDLHRASCAKSAQHPLFSSKGLGVPASGRRCTPWVGTPRIPRTCSRGVREPCSSMPSAQPRCAARCGP